MHNTCQNLFVLQQKNTSLKNWIIISLLLTVSFICLVLIVTINKNGFSDYKLMWKINKNLLIIIPIVSFGFGVSSFLIQQMSKNRLADTSILGMGNINLIALMIFIYNIDFGNDYFISLYKNVYPFIFIVLSVLTSVVIYFLSYNRNSNISKKFIVAGVILNFTFIAISYSLNNLMPSNKSTTIKDFSTGFIDTAENTSLYVALVCFVIAIVWFMFIYEKFKITTVNIELAKQLRIDTNKINLQVLIICGLLVGSSYALVGNVIFLGLFVGNIAFNIFKKNLSFALPATGLLGIIILSLTYVVNKNLLSTNVNTATLIPIMGIPYFLYLVIKE